MDIEAITQGFSLFSAQERTAILDALEGRETDLHTLISRLVLARRRALQRWESDSRTDVSRRILVGARIPRPLAERYRACAAGHGLSLYRFVCSALEREYDRLSTISTGDVEENSA